MNYYVENESLKVEVSDLGAQMMSITSKQTGKQYLWQGHPGYWKDRAPNLFPYIGRFTDGIYTYKGKTYSMQAHGLTRYMPEMDVTTLGEELIFELQEDAKSLEVYPFHFIFQVRYRVMGHALHIQYRVENTNDATMYFGVGGHPGFNLPFEPENAFEDYYVGFEKGIKPYQHNFSDNFLMADKVEYKRLQNGRLPLRHDLFDHDAIVLEDAGTYVYLTSDESDTCLRVDFPDMPFVGIWHKPGTNAPFVCIEPWSSLPSREGIVEDLETQPGLISLEAGGVYKNEWKVTISEGK